MVLDLHLFRVGDLSLAFAPVTDSLFALDGAGRDALDLARGGVPLADIRSRLARAHGEATAVRCLDELAAATAGLDTEVEDWLPSPPGALVLKSLCLNVAHACDLNCGYCFAQQGRFGGRRELMGAGVARAAVDLLLEMSGGAPSCEIDFFGGEPLLNLEVVRETVDYGRRRAAEVGKRIGFTLTTNAVALGPDEAAYLDDTMDNVVLSLDGRAAVHDRMRPLPGGGPSHATVLANIQAFIARRGDRDYWVRGTYTAWNLDFADDAVFLARAGARRISLEPAVGGPTGPGRWGLQSRHVPRLAAEYVRLAGFLAGETRAGRPVTFFHFVADPESGPCLAKRLRGCGAGREYMAVTPGGGLYPCHQFVGRYGYRAGSVLDDRGPGGRRRAEARPGAPGGAAVEVGRLWLGAKSACRGCWARYRCSGGCHANAVAATGSLLEPDPLGCAIMRVRLEAALYYHALLREQVESPTFSSRPSSATNGPSLPFRA